VFAQCGDEYLGHQPGISCLRQQMIEQFRKLFWRSILERQPRADTRAQRDKLGDAEQLDELTIAGQVHTAGPGTAIIIPGGVRHSGKALSDCRLLDVFYPVREEYRTGK